MSGQDLARWQVPSPQHQARVGGELSMRADELVIRLYPTSVTEQALPERQAQTVVTWPITPPLAVGSTTVFCRPARWVLDREAVTALVWFALVTALLVALWVVVG